MGTPIAVLYGTPITANGSPPVTTTCTPASGSVFNVGVSTVTCTATDALQRTDSCSFAVTVTAPPMIAVTRLMAFGDSITKGEDGTSLTASAVSRYTPSQILPTPQTYPGVLQTLLSTRYTAQMPTLDNQGCSGEGVTGDDSFCGYSSALARFNSFTSTRVYGAVLLMEGTNDLYQQKDSSNIGRTVANLAQMVINARSNGARVFLASVPPIDPNGSRGRMYGNQLVPLLNSGIQNVAAGQGATFVDVNGAFNNNLALLGPDGLHPSPAGYTLIANTFFTAIKATLETPGSGPVVPTLVQRLMGPLRRTR